MLHLASRATLSSPNTILCDYTGDAGMSYESVSYEGCLSEALETSQGTRRQNVGFMTTIETVPNTCGQRLVYIHGRAWPLGKRETQAKV